MFVINNVYDLIGIIIIKCRLLYGAVIKRSINIPVGVYWRCIQIK